MAKRKTTKRTEVAGYKGGGNISTVGFVSFAQKAYARERRARAKEYYDVYGSPYRWELKSPPLEDREVKEHVKVETKKDIEKAKKKTKLSEIECPKCRHTGVTEYAQKVHPEDIRKPDNEMRYLPIYRCKKCLHEFTPKSSKPIQRSVPKETPHQREIRTLTERNDLQKKRITSLNKEIKALKAENEQMKKEGIFPKGIPGQKKEKPAPITRFENII